MVFNHQYPGPTIFADWGDTLEVTVQNSLDTNGTSVHWHGFRQLNSNHMDGVNGITECPIAPGQSKTYIFNATQYGTSWYHSQYSIQAADGLLGSIVIRGPSTENYDIDLGALPVSDWYDTPAFTILAARAPAPPTSQSILVNGTGVTGGVGEYSITSLSPGKKHKLGFINTSLNQFIHVSLDNHKFLVVAADFIPIKPYVASSIVLSTGLLSFTYYELNSYSLVGQRYEVIVEANQTIDNYWLRVGTGGGQCDGPNQKNLNADTQGAIFRYAGASEHIPTTNTSHLTTGCTEETTLIPYANFTVPGLGLYGRPYLLEIVLDTEAGVVWKVNGEALATDWSKPTLQYAIDGNIYDRNTPLSIHNSINLGGEGFYYFLISNLSPVPHPIHLHGHDMYIMSQGLGAGSDLELRSASYSNIARRDSYSVEAGGYAIIAFEGGNQGAWLLQCATGWHISDGLGIQILDNPIKHIEMMGSTSSFKDECKSWSAWTVSRTNFSQGDSGL